MTVPSEPREIAPVDNPYRHDHNPLNADFHGGICSACEWELGRLFEEKEWPYVWRWWTPRPLRKPRGLYSRIARGPAPLLAQHRQRRHK